MGWGVVCCCLCSPVYMRAHVKLVINAGIHNDIAVPELAGRHGLFVAFVAGVHIYRIEGWGAGHRRVYFRGRKMGGRWLL